MEGGVRKSEDRTDVGEAGSDLTPALLFTVSLSVRRQWRDKYLSGELQNINKGNSGNVEGVEILRRTLALRSGMHWNWGKESVLRSDLPKHSHVL
jgi:hypothetical protein